jgi:hypothetical protein
MPAPRKSQKQIAQRYAENLRYFKNLNPFRRARILLALGCLLIAAALAVVYLLTSRSSQRLEKFNSPGGISQAHSGKEIDCESCHSAAVKPDLLKPAMVNASMDARCEVCHTQHTFHQADVVVDHSCTACHHEHLGPGPMQPVTDSNCVACHGDAAIMAASAQKGLHLPAIDFNVKPKDNLLVYFHPPRPSMGYTLSFQSFERDHPAFQIQREHLTDPNTLKFDHKFHLSENMPKVDGHKLDCAYCHKPDNRGAYMQPINFAKNCQSCHELQIDPTEPKFQIPHPTGDSQPNSVRDFLLTLPTQYQSFAIAKGITDPKLIEAYVNKQMMGIRKRTREGVDLVNEVYESDNTKIDFGFPGPSGTGRRPSFQGCALCHEVTLSRGEYKVTPPQTPDRWYVHAKFDHATHSASAIGKNCIDCHAPVFNSSKTSDISLPDQASCVTCHSAKGGVVSTCATCHDYHNSAPARDVARSPTCGSGR